jgi:hypothetical protein
MSKMYKMLLTMFLVSIVSFKALAQDKYWTSHAGTVATLDKGVARQSFPKEFKLFDLNIEPLRQQLMSVVDNRISHTAIISLPTPDGRVEQFEIVEASNFEPALQAQYPEIRAFSGNSVSDRSSMLKISLSPQGIQTMVFRTGSLMEFIEPYSADHTIYAVFQASHERGALPWTCTTEERNAFNEMGASLRPITSRLESSAGELKTMRLAQSCNAEYSNYFGATSSAQVGLVLAAFNATLTRCNGCYEKDLAIHLNLIANTSDVIYYNAATDPYTTMASWNSQLQSTLTSVIGEANYDIGHMFGASGGGGNAGCIGCVCVNGSKGSGITSPADAIPQGDNFDIDYVVHEVGHQMGGNHTFSMSLEGTGVNKEVGSGITIMGYAGITSQDVAPHSIDIYHEATIAQIQANMATKTCPVTTNISSVNATPVVAALTAYTIPITTPFALTGAATDANSSDVLTYCFEQNDNSTTSGSSSVASATKATGPNWLSFSPTTSTTRLMPKLSTILTGASITGCLPGGDAVANIEALSSVARTLNFRLTVRDNSAYSSTTPIKVGQTSYADVAITVSSAVGPFLITSQNTATSWAAATTQTITWSVNGTTGAPTNTANVKISLSTDGGNTFPIVLAASTANDGTEDIIVPSNITTTGRIKVEAIGNIYFDINNANITITAPVNGFSFNAPAAVTATCPASNVMTSGNLTATYTGTYTGDIALTGTVVPAGPTVSFSATTLTTGAPSATVSLTGMSSLAPGTYVVTVTGTGTGTTPPIQTQNISFTINPGSGPTVSTQPTDQTVCAGTNATFTAAATGATYQWQTGSGTTWSNITGATSASYVVTAATLAQSGTQYRCVVSGQCGSTNSTAATLTVNAPPAITSQPTGLTLCAGSSATFTTAGTGAGLTYQWQLSTDGGTTYTAITGATSASYTISATTLAMNNNKYRCVVSGTCSPAATSSAATLQVSSSITITTNPTSQTICEATNTSFTVAAQGSSLSYQWQVSTNGGTSFTNIANGGIYSGATTTTLTLTAVTPAYNTYQYRCIASNLACNPGTSTAATLTVNTLPVISSQPASVTICEGGNINFAVAASTGIGALSYQWQASTNGGTSWTSLNGATANSYSQTGVLATENSYQFRVVVTAGCGSINSTAATVTVNTYPVINFTPASNVCSSDPAFTLTATPAGGTFSGSGVTGSTFSPSAAGVGVKNVTYSVTTLGCRTDSTKIIQVGRCAERELTLEQEGSLTLYPNPNNGRFSIRVNTDLYTKLGLRIYDNQGRLIKTEAIGSVYYGRLLPMDLSLLPSGSYHLFFTNDELETVSKRTISIAIYK